MKAWPWLALAAAFGCTSPAKEVPRPEPTRWDFPTSIRTLDVRSEQHVRFAGSDGWVGMTTDAGLTWDTTQWVSPTGEMASFRASGFAETGWHAATIAGPGMVARSQRDSLHPTWQTLQDHDSAFFDAMHWLDDTTGIIFGDAVGDCLTMFRTTNAGQSWSRLPCNALPDKVHGEAAFAASNGNIASAGDTIWVVTGGAVSRVLRSLDAGQTWQATTLPVVQGGSMTGAFALSFADASTGLAIGGNWEDPKNNQGNLCMTPDGGNTWALVSEGLGPGYRSCVMHHPVDKDQVVATGFLGMDVSFDGGKNWTHVSDSAHYVARFAPSGRTLWLAGKGHVECQPWPPIVNPHERQRTH